MRLEVALGRARVLGRDPHRPEPPLGLFERRVAAAGGEHHAAGAVAEVEELVDGAVALLGEHVLAGDPEVGSARLDVGRHVGGAHGHEAELAAVEDQRPGVAAQVGRVDPDPVEQVERAGEEGRRAAARG